MMSRAAGRTSRYVRIRLAPITIAVVSLLAGCDRPAPESEPETLTGAWRSTVQFSSGAFASITDLQFMYVFNAGGTLTESSNYDGAPPVPPAYGVWRSVGPNEYEAKYEFFSTAPPPNFEALSGGGGWMPAGHGVLVERITVAPDGQSYNSTITYEAFDAAGQPAAGGGTAEGQGTKIAF
jgi:hypothetical protein